MLKMFWRKFWISRRLDLAALSVILVLFLLFFWPVFSSEGYFITNDGFIYSYPLRTVAWNSLRTGHLPLWTPLILSGYPLLSMAQIGIGYPLTWGYLFLPGAVAEEIYTLAPYLLFPAFTYAYLREIGRSRFASLFAALIFSYGGAMVSAVSYNGMLPNALMWLPLFLIVLERSGEQRFVPSLVAASGVYALSVLTGIGQGFVIVGTVALAYGLFLSLVAQAAKRGRWRRLQPFLVTLSAVGLAAGIAAFQILETLRAQRRSIRQHLSYEIFSGGSYSFAGLMNSAIAPLHHIIDASAYLAPLAFVLALIAVLGIAKRHTRDPRIWFWSVVGIVAVAFMLGSSTPIYRLLYHVPVFNAFRVPGRHAFELTFAVSILSAFGLDALEQRFRGRRADLNRPRIYGSLVLLAGAALVVFLWQRDLSTIPISREELAYLPTAFPLTHYLAWKLLFVLLIAFVGWFSWGLANSNWRAVLLTAALVLSCYAEPSLFAARWWWPTLKSADQFDSQSPTTQFLKQYPPEENRIYTRSVLFAEDPIPQRRLEPINMTMLHGLQNVAGYEPLILERYSRALGNVFLDGVLPRPGYPADESILKRPSHVLDLLNTRFVVTYSDFSPEINKRIEIEGIKFRARNPDLTLAPGETASLEGAAAPADTISLVSTLANSDEVKQGTPVIRLTLFTAADETIELELLAGKDTAEWAHERPDVKARVQHNLAPVFDSHPENYQGTEFPYYRFWTRFSFGQRAEIKRIELTNVSSHASWTLWKTTLFDSATKFSMPLPHYDLTKWEPVYDHDNVVILRNRSALPRAWLVQDAEAVDGEEALQRIRGEGDRVFDPGKTALLEIRPENLPRLPGGSISSNAVARLAAYEDNRLIVDTQSEATAVLVLSEINYPGWRASIDGEPVDIHTADYLLRAVFVPAGRHRVQMEYTAPAARNGAVISLASLVCLGTLLAYAWRHLVLKK